MDEKVKEIAYSWGDQVPLEDIPEDCRNCQAFVDIGYLLSRIKELDKEIETLQISINSYINNIQINLKERRKLISFLSGKDGEDEQLKKKKMDENIMDQWDRWRHYIASGGTASWPRDEFENLISLLKGNLSLCEICWQILEPDGSCLTCRLEKHIKELEAKIKELEKGIEKHRKYYHINDPDDFYPADQELYNLLKKEKKGDEKDE